MVRTQVQLPDDLYRQVKRIAAEQETTLADVVRRGLEHMVRVYPPREDTAEPWRPPRARSLGPFQVPVEAWRELANEGRPPVS